MPRIYSAQFNGVAVTAQQDIFEVNVASTKVVKIHSLHLSQSTEVGDAQEEGLSILFKAGATTSGSGGTTPTAVPRALGDAAYAGTVEANNTTKATARARSSRTTRATGTCACPSTSTGRRISASSLPRPLGSPSS
jgi:hypothetical protein